MNIGPLIYLENELALMATTASETKHKLLRIRNCISFFSMDYSAYIAHLRAHTLELCLCKDLLCMLHYAHQQIHKR